jgi:hypothetical protein
MGYWLTAALSCTQRKLYTQPLQPHPKKQQHDSAPSSSRRTAVLCRAQNVHQYCKAAVASTTPRGVQLAAKPVVVRVWSMCGTLYNFSMINYSFVR